jgi:hypothetical protein
MRYAALLLLVAVAACAKGQDPSDVDAADQSSIDASGDASGQIDAPLLVDAPDTDATAIDAAMIDATVDAATDAMVIDAPDGGVTNADTCTSPPDITAAAMQGSGTTITGDLTGHGNQIQPSSTCTGFTNDGPDDIYVLNLPTSGRTITATVNASWDSAVEIVQPCSMTPTCLVGRDAGNPEAVTYTTTASGVFYVIVDSWDPGAYGPYTLTVRVQ